MKEAMGKMYIPKNGIKYTPEIIRFMKKHIKGCACILDLVSLVNKHFKTAFTYKQIRSAMYYNGLCGKKRGGHPKPLLSEITTVRGVVMIKVKNKGTQHQMWKRKNRFVWEQANGKIPPNHKIIFLDKNTKNCAIENLACIPENVFGYMLKYGLLLPNAEHTKTGIRIAELALGIAERRKELPIIPIPTGHYKNRNLPVNTYFIDNLGNKIYVDKTDNGLFYLFKDGKKGKKELNTKFTDIVRYRETAEQSLQDLLAYARKVDFGKPKTEAV